MNHDLASAATHGMAWRAAALGSWRRALPSVGWAEKKDLFRVCRPRDVTQSSGLEILACCGRVVVASKSSMHAITHGCRRNVREARRIMCNKVRSMSSASVVFLCMTSVRRSLVAVVELRSRRVLGVYVDGEYTSGGRVCVLVCVAAILYSSRMGQARA